MTPHVIGLSPVLSTPYLATAAMDKCIRVHAASLRQLALPVIVVGPGKHDRSCFRSDCLPRLRSPATWLKIKCGDFLMQRGVSLISHHILNCGIFARFWRGRVQITADPEWHVRLRSEPAKVDNHDNHDVRVPIACCPWRVFARNLSCGSQRHPDQPLNGFCRDAPARRFHSAVVKSLGAPTGDPYIAFHCDRRAKPINLNTARASAAPMVPSRAIRAVEVSVRIAV